MMKVDSGRKIFIFDTTLRDGEQSPGASLTADEKVEIAKQLERLNVDVLEAGFPAASPGEIQAVSRISRSVKTPVICGLARMVRKDIDACREALKPARRRRLHVFLATSSIHRKYKLGKEKEELVRIVKEHLHYARKFFDDIEFSPEDAARTEWEFLVDIVRTAIENGATTVNIPDTVGYAIPHEFGKLICYLTEQIPVLGKDVNLSVHCHNDLGLATSNSLAAVANGANQVECTINGIGERAGNASLEEIVMAIDTRGELLDAGTDIQLSEIIKTSRLVSHLTGMPVQPNKAIVGRNAFSHESGIHQDGVLKMRQTYEILDPQKIGLSGSQLVLGKLSGRHAFRDRLKKLGYEDLNAAELQRAFGRFKELGDQKKFIFDEDLQAIVEETVTKVPVTWELIHLQISIETGKRPSALIRLKRGRRAFEGRSGGDGPVDACYKVIEKLTGLKIKLVDYSLRAVTGGKDALGEVVVKAQIKGKQLTGRAASTDIIEASAKALLQAINRSYAHPFQRTRAGLV